MKSFSYYFLSLVIGIFLSITLSQVLAAFSEPTTAPPGGNTPEPLNVGGTGQIKVGGLTLGGALIGASTSIFATDPGTNVGIGTTGPATRLQVHGVSTGDAVSDVVGRFTKNSSLGATFDIAVQNSLAVLQTGSFSGGGHAVGIAFSTRDVSAGILERMRIQSDGNVGIGTTSPGFKLDVNGTVNATDFTKAGAPLAAIPSGLIGFFAGGCPAGWTEYTAAQGRAILGQMGSPGSAQGTALTSSLPTRTITDVPAHTHPIDPPPATTSPATTLVYTFAPWTRGGVGGWGNVDTEGTHTHSVDIGPFTSVSTGLSSVDVTMPYIQLRACKAP